MKEFASFHNQVHDQPSTLQQRQALKTTHVGDPKVFTRYDRIKDKSLQTRKEEYVESTATMQENLKVTYEQKVKALVEKENAKKSMFANDDEDFVNQYETLAANIARELDRSDPRRPE